MTSEFARLLLRAMDLQEEIRMGSTTCPVRSCLHPWTRHTQGGCTEHVRGRRCPCLRSGPRVRRRTR